ncbi:MAG: ChrR family anti-sigma-E factor [Alphaproteobacteria bacterium]|nr:ChrR family anti-sigma-E factor [Alphaproteobacteria bacterium]
MTASHHVSDELLLAYEAGSLAEGWSLAVATHLSFCPDCRARARQAAALGGALLATLDAVPLADHAFEAVLARIGAPAPASNGAAVRPVASAVPAPLRDYVGADLNAVRWKRIGTAGYQALIPTGDGQTSVRLLRIPAGQPVPEHGHRGLELTVVLRGMLVDGQERFGVGEIEEANDELEHQPCAGAEEDCICLAVTDAPLRFKSRLVRLVQPFLGI